jgi:hypothetical protein
MQQHLPQLVLNAILNAASGMPLPWLPAITRCPSLPCTANPVWHLEGCYVER